MEAVGKQLETILMHYEQKDYVSAEKLLDNLLLSHPNFHRAWFLKGVVLEETGKKDQAAKYYDKAGNCFTLWFRLAMQLQEVDPQRAMVYFDRVSEMDKKNNMIWFYKGMVSEKLGNIEEARRCFRNLSPLREFFSRIVIPSGFMIFLIIGTVMMIKSGETALSLIVLASAVFCMFWLKRDAGQAVQMLIKKKQYR
ncbi:MAG: Tetratricopeptide 1 repeat-containing protein [Nitrospirae bacterium]|nr:Tetratricopeptide 1 repeat-containing protein [Nitrospirota bacterium]